jgi:hypothetical protein
MPEITIPIDTPGVRPPVESKTYNEAYILDLNIRAHGMNAEDSVYLEICPYDKATGDRLLTDRREIRLPLWEIVQQVPEAATAFAAIAAAIPALLEYQKNSQ